MSDERRKRQQQRVGEAEPNPWVRKIGILVLIAAICGGLYAFVHHQQTSRYKAFAQCLNTKGATMYGAFWCPHCADQKELFGSSFEYVNYVECGIKGSRNLAQVCTDANIKHFPTWVFADGSRVEGEHPLDFLSGATGCALP
jgi:hypothetical protein